MSLCECGCGKPTPIAKLTNSRRGHIAGQPVRFVRNHHLRNKRMAEHPSWRGGKALNSAGYMRIRTSIGYLYEHRLIMERLVGRKLHRYEVVHHVDGNTLNNDPSNLWLFPDQSSHRLWHTDGGTLTRPMPAVAL